MRKTCPAATSNALASRGGTKSSATFDSSARARLKNAASNGGNCSTEYVSTGGALRRSAASGGGVLCAPFVNFLVPSAVHLRDQLRPAVEDRQDLLSFGRGQAHRHAGNTKIAVAPQYGQILRRTA